MLRCVICDCTPEGNTLLPFAAPKRNVIRKVSYGVTSRGEAPNDEFLCSQCSGSIEETLEAFPEDDEEQPTEE